MFFVVGHCNGSVMSVRTCKCARTVLHCNCSSGDGSHLHTNTSNLVGQNDPATNGITVHTFKEVIHARHRYSSPYVVYSIVPITW